LKLASFRFDGKDSFGIVEGDEIIDIGSVLRQFPTLDAFLAAGLPFGDAAKSASRISGKSVEWLPVIRNPGKIFCIGLNYRDHVAESAFKEQEYPSIFTRLPSSHVGHLQPMLRPKVSERFDFEGELAVIIGKAGRHVERSRWAEHVAGYAIYNDGSVRDWQHRTTQWIAGKNFDNSGAFGPWMTTADEIPNPDELHMTTRLNGKVMQDTSVDLMIFKTDYLIWYISAICELKPGDIIVTGTCAGVGLGRKPPVWMVPGDTIEIEISGIGVLRNPIAQEE
jgi:2-keto-4-pentenoate hydratase/2-oxohepta-3-ene-1,7-dioic acid hydratase in catechol pathway